MNVGQQPSRGECARVQLQAVERRNLDGAETCVLDGLARQRSTGAPFLAAPPKVVVGAVTGKVVEAGSGGRQVVRIDTEVGGEFLECLSARDPIRNAATKWIVGEPELVVELAVENQKAGQVCK